MHFVKSLNSIYVPENGKVQIIDVPETSEVQIIWLFVVYICLICIIVWSSNWYSTRVCYQDNIQRVFCIKIDIQIILFMIQKEWDRRYTQFGLWFPKSQLSSNKHFPVYKVIPLHASA